MNPWLLLGGAAAFGLLWMFALYLVHLRTRDAGIVDFGWSGGMGIVAVAYAFVSDGDTAHRIALGMIAGAWSFRLAFYILRDRVMSSEEDARYKSLREHWGAAAPRNFLFVFLGQGLLIALLSVPFLMTARQTEPLNGWDYAAIAVAMLSIAGESLADRQLSRWRHNPANRGKTCRAGLWRYSRHPNYFFEWLHWWCYVLLCVGSWDVLGALLGPALMLLFLYRVTGIPYTERQALRSRGDDYRRYQESTSPFIPWFPKESS
ncbi:MAG: DUF1295 domain-containing protein [Candidatus Hydrogenedentes bacterium]|nr:DUF1295 domain-containing protein [Candidatus Hydrogenedentota bacterium]